MPGASVRRRVLAVLALAPLSMASCGGDDAGDAPPATHLEFEGDVHDELVRLTLAGLSEQGIDADPGCLTDLAAQLSDDDARKLVDAYPNGDPQVSDEARGIGARLLECADRDDLLQTLVTSIVATAPVSEACVHSVLDPLDTAQLAALLQPGNGDDNDSTSDDPAVQAAVDQLIACRPSTT